MCTCRVATAATAPPFWGNLTFELVPKPGQLATNGFHHYIGGLLAHVVVDLTACGPLVRVRMSGYCTVAVWSS